MLMMRALFLHSHPRSDRLWVAQDSLKFLPSASLHGCKSGVHEAGAGLSPDDTVTGCVSHWGIILVHALAKVRKSSVLIILSVLMQAGSEV